MLPIPTSVKMRNQSLGFLIKIISSVFGIGYSPFLPGTLASLVAFLVYVFFIRGNFVAHFACVLSATAIGLFFSSSAEKLFGRNDARQIVLDDFNGMLLGLLFLPYNINLAVIGFIVFRIMDGLKPYPIYKIEKLHGSLGVMGDDIIAGLYTNIVLQFLKTLSQLTFHR